MKADKARSIRASAPDKTTKRAPDILAAVLKSIWPSASPRSKCSLASKPKSFSSPHLRSSRLSSSSAPSGTSSAGILGISLKISSSLSPAFLTAASASACASLDSATSFISASVSSPWLFFWPMIFDSSLRRVCSSCAVVCASRRRLSISIKSAAIGSSPRREIPASNA